MSSTRAFVLGVLTGLLLCGAVVAMLILLGDRADEQRDSRQDTERAIGGAQP